MNQKTVAIAVMELVSTKVDVKWKKRDATIILEREAEMRSELNGKRKRAYDKSRY
jgi:hypothetical protein